MYLDTHIVVWLFAGQIELIPSSLKYRLESESIEISPIVMMELQYLKEIDRIKTDACLIIETLQREIGMKVCDHSFLNIVTEALAQSWTRDPFDRIIVAQAACMNAELATKDRHIHAQYDKAIWG